MRADRWGEGSRTTLPSCSPGVLLGVLPWELCPHRSLHTQVPWLSAIQPECRAGR